MQQALSGYEASLRAQLAPVHLNLGTVMMMQGDSNGALREYQLAVASDPSSGAALTNLALALMARGDAAGAREKLEEAVRADPNLLEAHLHLGELLLALGETASGTAHLERAAESPDPRSAAPLRICCGASNGRLHTWLFTFPCGTVLEFL